MSPAKNLTVVLLSLPVTACAVSSSRIHEFALIGDNPYSESQFGAYLHMIDDINAHPDLRWVIHLGDVKSASASCSDTEMQRYFDFNQRFNMPFVVTPGDNDWLDCTNPAAGRFNEYERLTAFRRLFYPVPGQTTGQRPMAVSQQSEQANYGEFVENARWTYQDVVYATVHAVALTLPAGDPVRNQARIDAAIAWIRQTFREASNTDAEAVFMAMQADPWPLSGSGAAARVPRGTLEWLYPVLAEESLAFGKPVVLAVGDTHVFRVDKPLFDADSGLVVNFTRVEGFGSPQVQWVNVRVEPDTPWVFSFQQQIVN